MEIINQSEEIIIDCECIKNHVELMREKHIDQMQVIENIRKRSSFILTLISIPFFQIITSYKISELGNIIQTLLVIDAIILFAIISILFISVINSVNYQNIDLCDEEFIKDLKNMSSDNYYNDILSGYYETIKYNNKIIKNLGILVKITAYLTLAYVGILLIVGFSM